MEPDTIPDTWPRFPAAERFFRTLLDDFATHNPEIALLRGKMAAVGVDIATLIDHWILPTNSVDTTLLADFGLQPQNRTAGDTVWETNQARLPGIRFKNRNAPTLAIRVESIEDYASANQLDLDHVHGTPGSPYRCGHLRLAIGELMPIERRGTREFFPVECTTAQDNARQQLRETLLQRNRTLPETTILCDIHSAWAEAAKAIGNGPAVEVFFETERTFYQSRNTAARWQKSRQDTVGIGWANHDHHTYRCSREIFQPLLQLFLPMGFECRERFHAGAEAGWGAQILEHPESNIVLFVDVDLAPGEEDTDFARQPLPPRAEKATIGLWCALHGSSIGAAGLHHLECEFLHDIVRDQFQAAGGTVMDPFTNLPVLWQAFTAAQRWPVPQDRLEKLVAEGNLAPEIARSFAVDGAPGSHLEILQRWEGWKGFHKTAVSRILAETNARNS